MFLSFLVPLVSWWSSLGFIFPEPFLVPDPSGPQDIVQVRMDRLPSQHAEGLVSPGHQLRWVTRAAGPLHHRDLPARHRFRPLDDLFHRITLARAQIEE